MLKLEVQGDVTVFNGDVVISLNVERSVKMRRPGAGSWRVVLFRVMGQ